MNLPQFSTTVVVEGVRVDVIPTHGDDPRGVVVQSEEDAWRVVGVMPSEHDMLAGARAHRDRVGSIDPESVRGVVEEAVRQWMAHPPGIHRLIAKVPPGTMATVESLIRSRYAGEVTFSWSSTVDSGRCWHARLTGKTGRDRQIWVEGACANAGFPIPWNWPLFQGMEYQWPSLNFCAPAPGSRRFVSECLSVLPEDIEVYFETGPGEAEHWGKLTARELLDRIVKDEEALLVQPQG